MKTGRRERGSAKVPSSRGPRARLALHPLNATSSTSSVKSTSAAVMHIGGLMRSVLPNRPPLPTSTPISRSASHTASVSCVAGSLVSRSRTSSTPSISPMPRTSPIRRCRVCSSSSPALSRPPTTRAFSCRPSSSMMSSTASPAAIETGLPPKVLKWIAGGDRLGDLAARRHGGERPAVADALGHRDDVGHDAEVLEAPVVLARCGRSRSALRRRCRGRRARARCVGLPQVVRRAVRRAADALDRLGDERGDPARRRIADQVADVLRALPGDLLRRTRERAPVRVGIDRVVDAEVGLLGELPGVVRGQRHGRTASRRGSRSARAMTSLCPV